MTYRWAEAAKVKDLENPPSVSRGHALGQRRSAATGASRPTSPRAPKRQEKLIACFDLAGRIAELIKIPRANQHFDPWRSVLIICIQPRNSALLNVRGILRLEEGESVVKHTLFILQY